MEMTSKEVLELLIRKGKPCTPKEIAFELKKSEANIRKILSNLYKQGRIAKLEYGTYASLQSVNVEKIPSVNVKTDKAQPNLNESVNVSKKKCECGSVNVKNENIDIEELAREKRNAYYRAYFKTYIRTPEAKERISAYSKKYRAEHREQINAYERQYLKKWRAEHKEKTKEYCKRYWQKKALSEVLNEEK